MSVWAWDWAVIEEALLYGAKGEKCPKAKAREALAVLHAGVEVADTRPEAPFVLSLEAFIRLFDEAACRPPTLKELAQERGISMMHAHRHVYRLAAHRCLAAVGKKGRWKARAWAPTDRAREVLPVWLAAIREESEDPA